MWGIDVSAARGLVFELGSWQSRISEIELLLSQAETLSDLAPPVRPRLASLESQGRAMASALDTAIDELVGHRTAIDTRLGRLAPAGGLFGRGGFAAFVASSARNDFETDEAQRLLDKIGKAAGRGRPANPKDHERLRLIFDEAISDRTTAEAALALALSGLPASSALAFRSVTEIDATFDQVQAAMSQGRPPSEASLPASLFPPAYVDWHRINARRLVLLDELRESVDGNWFFGSDMSGVDRFSEPIRAITAELDSIRLAGVDGKPVQIGDRGSVARAEAAMSIAAFHGPTASEWLGAALALELGASSHETDVRTGEILVSDSRAGVAFFNELDAQGTARLPEELTPGVRLELFGQALANVSANPALGFTGAELIRADTIEIRAWQGYPTRPHPELLLMSEGFDERFFLDAVTESLRVRGRQHLSWPVGHVDPRSLALAAVVATGRGDVLLLGLDASDELGLLLSPPPPGRFGAVNNENVAQGSLSPVHLLFAQGATNPLAAAAVVDHIATHPEAFDTPFEDQQIANGVSSMLAISALEFVEREVDRRRFLNAYQLVLDSGAGLDVALSCNNLIEREVRTQLQAGTLEPDLTATGLLVGQIEQLRSETHHDNEALRDKAATEFNQIASVTSGIAGVALTAVGIATLPATAPALAAAGLIVGLFGVGVSIWGPDADRLVPWLESEVEGQTRVAESVTRQILFAAFTSGLARAPGGNPVEVRALDDEDDGEVQVIDTDTDEVLYEGDLRLDDQGLPIDLDTFEGFYFVDAEGSVALRMSELVRDVDDVVRFIMFPQIER